MLPMSSAALSKSSSGCAGTDPSRAKNSSASASPGAPFSQRAKRTISPPTPSVIRGPSIASCQSVSLGSIPRRIGAM